MKRAIGAVTIILALGSCELSEKQCADGNWFSIGEKDGQDGRSPEFLSKHIKTCNQYGIIPDQSLWEQGRQKGLLVYCTPQSAYEVGANGLPLRKVCPANGLSLLEAANKKGQKYHTINRKISNLLSEKRGIEADLASLGNSTADQANRARLQSRLGRINLDIQLLSVDRRRYAEF